MSLPAYEDDLAIVYLGECLDVLRGMPDASVDAVVTDPPAAIAFMARSWDTFTRERFIEFMTDRMVECLRVLKPGGHALIWAIPRTSHWTGMAIEEAGFEVRDFVCHHFGSGFPKSLDVSKAIDKAAGAEREALPDPEAARRNKGPRAMMPGGGEREALAATTAPATDAAKQWDGWGTALKPATEIWWLARKPLAEPTVASQVLATGTGALNVDACRVAHGADVDLSAVQRQQNRHDGTENWRLRPGHEQQMYSAVGRWPADLVLTHSPDCRQLGTRKVQTAWGQPNRGGDPNGNTYGQGMPRGDQRPVGFADPDGTETVEAWECAEGCPVAEMDRQSGIGKSPASYQRTAPKGSSPLPMNRASDKREGDGLAVNYGDRGGASRFFYTAKASARERNEGLPEGTRNGHVSVKPIALMRYLCRLITPPGGLVCDPFMGSGSTGVAAVREGFRFIGIEKDEESCGVAVARIRHAVGQVAKVEQPAGQAALFDLTEAAG